MAISSTLSRYARTLLCNLTIFTTLLRHIRTLLCKVAISSTLLRHVKTLLCDVTISSTLLRHVRTLLCVVAISSTLLRHVRTLLCDVALDIPTSKAGVWDEYSPLPSGTFVAVQQRRVHGHFTRRFKNMVEEKWTAGQEQKGRTCPL